MTPRVDRRAFLAGVAAGTLAAPLGAGAQPAGKVNRIGFLATGSATGDLRPLDAFREGLRELGWTEGKNLVIEYRWAEGQLDRLPDLAAELARLKVDVIAAATAAPVLAAKKATGTIPIVMLTVADPVGRGLVASLSRPGGNVTGVTYGVGTETFGKGLELLREAAPKVRRVAALSNPAGPTQSLMLASVKGAARSLGLELQLVEARGLTEFDGAFAAMRKGGVEALLVVTDPAYLRPGAAARLADLAAKSRLPSIHSQSAAVEAGGLMSYGPSIVALFRRAASYVDKILKGAKPADLPIEQPTKFELVINLKTAKALGLTIPPSMLQRAGAPGHRVMDRRAFLGSLAFLAAPLGAGAQPAGKVPRVGVLGPGSASGMLNVQREPFERGLRELGWNPSVNVFLEYRYGEESPTVLATQAAGLVSLGVDVIVARGPVAIRAARHATTTIPIVMATTADPVRLGFVKSLARPGGNTTGIANLTWELDGKRLQLLKEALPRLTRVGVLANQRNKEQFPAILGAAQALGLTARVFEVTQPDEIGKTFELVDRASAEALLVATDIQVLEPSRARIVAMAARHRLPAMYPWRFYVEIGGLMSYSTNLQELHRRSATFVDKILKGAKPADLPIEQPTKFELVINLKTAKTLGLTIPPSLLQRADHVIE